MKEDKPPYLIDETAPLTKADLEKLLSDDTKCPTHHIDLVYFCPACRGSIRTKKKAKSSRLNGKKHKPKGKVHGH